MKSYEKMSSLSRLPSPFFFSLSFSFTGTCILEFNSYALKKVILCSASFFTDSLMRWTFFSSLPRSLVLVLIFSPTSLSSSSSSSSHPDSCYQRKKKNERKSQWLYYLGLYIYILVWQTKRKEWPDSCSPHVCPQSFLYTFRNDEKSTKGNSLLIYSIQHRWFSCSIK